MTNLTITVDEEILRKARIRALERGTSVNAILAEYLRSFAAGTAPQAGIVRSLVALADEGRGPAAAERTKKRGRRKWTREELHER